MKLEDILKKQQARGLKHNKFKAATPSIEEYTRDINSPRPYHYENNEKLLEISPKKQEELIFIEAVKPKNTIETPKKEILQAKKTPTQASSKVGRKHKEEFNYEHLVGNSKLIVDEIVRVCLIRNSLSTEFVNKKFLSEKLGIKEGSIKTTCARLLEKKVLENIETTKGRNSQWKFYLSPKILDQVKK